jgi:hypothetical protein
VSEKCREMIAEATQPLAAFVRNIIKRELAYINTQNADFVNSPLVLNASQVEEEPPTAAEKEEKNWFSWGEGEKEKPGRQQGRGSAGGGRGGGGAPGSPGGPRKRDEGGKVTLGALPSNLNLPEDASVRSSKCPASRTPHFFGFLVSQQPAYVSAERELGRRTRKRRGSRLTWCKTSRARTSAS